jgi:hypothetical protein
LLPVSEFRHGPGLAQNLHPCSVISQQQQQQDEDEDEDEKEAAE